MNPYSNMISKEQQVKNSFIYLLPVIVGEILPFVTIPIFTRILTPEDFGALALAQVYALFVAGLANFGMTVAYERNYFQYREDRLKSAQLLYSILLFVLLNFLLLAGVTYLARGFLSKLVIRSARYEEVLLGSVWAQLFIVANYYYLIYFRNSEAAKSNVSYTVAASIISFILSLFLVGYLRAGIMGIVYSQLSSGAIVFGMLSYKFLRLLPLSVNKTVFTESLKIAAPLTPKALLGVVGTQFDKYLAGVLISVGGAGIYSIGQKISYSVFAYMTAIQNVFIPPVYKKMFEQKERGREAIAKYLVPFAYVSIAMALLVALFSEEAIVILTPSSYHGAIDIVAVLSMYYGSSFFAKVAGQQLIFAKKTHITSVLAVAGVGLNVGLCIPFALKWGVPGVAWAVLLSGIISGVLTFFISQHYYEIYWNYKEMGAIHLLFFGSSLLMILLRHANVDYHFRVIVKLASLTIYGYLGIQLRILNAEAFALVKSVARSIFRKPGLSVADKGTTL